MNEKNEGLVGKRNPYLDACRGVAAISVIAIHTAFYGYLFVPDWFKSLTLLIDVPFFFYLSGWASSYRRPDVIKTGKSILRIWAQWIVFIILIEILCLLTVKLPYSYSPLTDFSDLLKSFLFADNMAPGFYVVGSSTWFIPYFFGVLLLNNAVLTIFNRSSRPEEYAKAYTIFLFLSIIWVGFGDYFFGLDVPFILFYGTIWMMGYIGFAKTKRFSSFILAILAAITGLILSAYVDYHLNSVDLLDMQTSKCLPSLKYFFFSLFVIIISRYVENFVKKPSRILAHIGENALYYFFGQGVGSSILSHNLIKPLSMIWFPVWFIAFLINLILTVIVAESTRFIYRRIKLLVLNIYEKTRRIE
ncbi:MAG: acyltransferase [Lachnospiraceae bacterium]|nr:acyltransferase [Lachnospiraceae bacterium]